MVGKTTHKLIILFYIAFKLEVALHAKRYSQYAAAKIFSVAR